jgi:hypothetical protein
MSIILTFGVYFCIVYFGCFCIMFTFCEIGPPLYGEWAVRVHFLWCSGYSGDRRLGLSGQGVRNTCIGCATGDLGTGYRPRGGKCSREME